MVTVSPRVHDDDAGSILRVLLYYRRLCERSALEVTHTRKCRCCDNIVLFAENNNYVPLCSGKKPLGVYGKQRYLFCTFLALLVRTVCRKGINVIL